MKASGRLASAALTALLVAACGGGENGPPAPMVAPAGAGARTAPAAWPTYHRDNSRAGFEPSGPAPTRVRRVWTATVDQEVYAEPLAVGGVVVAATENDSVYGFDAATGRRLWRTHLATPVEGGALPCGNIDPSGITGTPVVDASAGTVYVVTFERPAHHRLVALDLETGAVRWRRAVDPPGSDPRVEQQRSALSLASGRVYVAYGGLYGDCGDFHGYVVGVDAREPARELLSFRVPAQREAGIWAPSGAAVDPAGNVFVATGNSGSTTFDYGNAVMRLSPRLALTDYFAPTNAGELSTTDTDLGSVGPLLLPGERMLVVGKDGNAYLLSTRRLGHVGGQLDARSVCPAYGGLAYAAGYALVPCHSGLVALDVRGRGLAVAWRGPSFDAGPPIVTGSTVWSVDLQNGLLRALDLRTGRERFQTPIGQPTHFAAPAAGGGRVFVAASRRVSAFGR